MTPHRPHRLPAQIAAAMGGTIAAFLATLAVTVLALVGAMDRQAQQGSVILVEKALAGLAGQVLTSTLDYAKWDEATLRVGTLDLDWLQDNFGLVAEVGQTAQVVLLRGGPVGAEIGWTHDDPGAPPGPGPFDAATLRALEEALAAIAPGEFAGRTFFARSEDGLLLAAGAHVDYVGPDGPAIPREAAATLVMARRLDAAVVQALSDSTLLRNLALDRAEGPGRLSLPLPGPDGQRVASLSWDAPRPGSDLLRRFLPMLVPVTALAAGLGLIGLVLARRSALGLVAAQRAAQAAAHTDALTGLPNRAAFLRALASGEAERAVIFLDVNGFKRINDSLGHAVGDEVIRRVAERLATLSDPDCLLARIGGDEFVFVVTGAGAAFRATWIAHAAERALAAPLSVRGHRLQLQAAVGVAPAAPDMDGAELLRRADLAMYEGKRRGTRGPVAFDAVIEKAGEDAGALEAALRAALAREGELWIAYQPIVAAEGRTFARAEALARWTSPELGPVPPDRFIALAERSGLITELGRKLLHLVCDDLARQPGLRVSVNVSPLQLTTPDFVPDLLDLLASRGVAPDRLQVELTEGVLVDDPDLAARRVGELNEAGIRVALDDFGTGYSSVGTLRRIPFDTLKIDRRRIPLCRTPSQTRRLRSGKQTP